MHGEKVEISSIPSFIPRPHIDITGHTMSALTVVCKTKNHETFSQMTNSYLEQSSTNAVTSHSFTGRFILADYRSGVCGWETLGQNSNTALYQCRYALQTNGQDCALRSFIPSIQILIQVATNGRTQ
jgi:hypothetical protein